mgnify:FL=1
MTVNQKVNILLILLLIVVVSFMFWLLSNPVADDYNFSAYDNLKNREYTKSIEDYDKAIKLDSTDAELYNMRGVAKNEFFMFDEALADYDKAIELDSNVAVYYMNRGYLKLWHVGDTIGALEDLNRSHSLDSLELLIYFARGSLFLETKKYSKAIDDLSVFIKFYEDDNIDWGESPRVEVTDENIGMIYFLRGNAKYFTNQIEAACEDWKIALSLGYKSTGEETSPPILLDVVFDRYCQKEIRN